MSQGAKRICNYVCYQETSQLSLNNYNFPIQNGSQEGGHLILDLLSSLLKNLAEGADRLIFELIHFTSSKK